MSRMSACYFCGTALADPDPYTVLPGAAGGTGDDGPEIDLCRDCRRKLDAVLEEAGAATTARRRAPAPPPDGDSGATDAPAGGGEGPRQGETDAAVAADPDATDQDDGAAAEASSGAAPAGADTGPLFGDDGDGDASGADGDGDDAAEADAGADGTGGGGEASDDASPFADVSVSRADFRRVMRLLENREFPVDRAEIVTVATSAYDISEETCGAILDAAVEAGRLDEADGRLRRPE